ncbi:MAG: DNA repair protein [Acidobacteria bacterium]|nr:MAG: DNA repair protein [Acidobacteriota bacterium]
MRRGRVWTVGHSNHPLEKFIGILKAHEIESVLDVRNVGMPDLGGRRKPRADSPHVGWRSDAFRGYADYMDTEQFIGELARAMSLARASRSALMCAEAVPWRCHRSVLADAFLARGWEVFEILSEKAARPHVLPGFARREGDRVIYDRPPQGDLALG